MLKIKKNTGFTIIEVLIVLAVAGLVLVIVLFAVPKLAQNSRNNARKAEISRILGVMNEYRDGHSGKYPPDQETFNTEVLAGSNLKNYSIDDISYLYNISANVSNPNNEDQLIVTTGAKCSEANAIHGSGVSILFTLEANQNVCQEM